MDVRIGAFSLTGTGRSGGALDLRVVPSGQVQTVLAIGAPGIDLIDRGNDQHVVTFNVWREFLDDGAADPEAAALFVATHIADVRAVGRSVLTLTNRYGSVYFAPAIARVTQGYQVGCATNHSYTITAGAISLSLPPGY